MDLTLSIEPDHSPPGNVRMLTRFQFAVYGAPVGKCAGLRDQSGSLQRTYVPRTLSGKHAEAALFPAAGRECDDFPNRNHALDAYR